MLHKVGDKMAEKLGGWEYGRSSTCCSFPCATTTTARMRTLNKLRPGEVTTVVVAVNRSSGGKRLVAVRLLMTVDDDTAKMRVAFFRQMWLGSSSGAATRSC